ncbi:MAG: hypothetical protein IID05_13515 [Gemmatimonadetes bacterium]|nr:hypothetical protein [Gemmatimonadota bacterium]
MSSPEPGRGARAYGRIWVCSCLPLMFVIAPSLADENPTGDFPSRDQIVEWLSELQPLSKVHYSWPLRKAFLSDPADPLLYEYVRLTHAITVGDPSTSDMVDVAVQVCAEVNAAYPRIPATLGVKYSPYHREFEDTPPTEFGLIHRNAVANFTRKFQNIRDWIAESNARHGTDVWVSRVFLDAERFRVTSGDTFWNDSMRVKYNLAYDAGKYFFPRAGVEWIAYGGVRRDSSASGWGVSLRFTFDEESDAFSCALFRVPELGYTQETFRRTYELAQEYDVDEVTPWIALGSGFRRTFEKRKLWTFVWDYDLWYSWQLGAEINKRWYGNRSDRYAPWHAATVAAFYPEPFGRAPYWGEHFVAYVRGANGIKPSP